MSGAKMGKLIDLTGQRFGRLLVIGRAENELGGQPRWICQCDCGAKKTIRGSHLRQGLVKSCGCLNKELLQSRNIERGCDGRTSTRLYRIWINIKKRCHNNHCPAYLQYGGRGISICGEWETFQAFQAWALTSGYTDGLTIDRIDNNKGYDPDNCRWANATIQANNRRSNRMIFYNGEVRTLAEWCKLLCLPYKTVWARLKAGWDLDDAFHKF